MGRIENFKRILLAVSGGLDSICLAHYFIKNQKAFHIEWLGIAHVNHGLREISADLDEVFVRDFSAKYNVPFFVKHLDARILKAQGSLEENAREARYTALLNIARKNQAEVIFTAHHQGDQAETLVQRMLRGVSLAGLQGVYRKRTFHEIFLYRPFLEWSKSDLAHYAKENHLHWREDESNWEIHFYRNWVRHHILKNLESFNPNCSNTLVHIANLMQRVYPKIIAQCETYFAPFQIPEENFFFDKELLPLKNIFCFKIQILENQKAKECLRLYLDFKGMRFPITADFYAAQKMMVSYRNRFVEKSKNCIWFYELEDKEIVIPEEKNAQFANSEGTWRTIQDGDILAPLDKKIKPRPLKEWLRDKGVPRALRKYFKVFAHKNQVYHVLVKH